MTTVNGSPYRPTPGETVQQLIQAQIGRTAGIAVAIDGAVVPKSRWEDTPVAGDVEIVTAAQGG
ncbi:sulfur carrier protein ThiS [Corynebacterium sp. H128]|uniref:sulfur carrier protein ThiS n=1 Tax=unclassified Corynebacterium TaxID=2624378 RepID=UPI0030B6EB2A